MPFMQMHLPTFFFLVMAVMMFMLFSLSFSLVSSIHSSSSSISLSIIDLANEGRFTKGTMYQIDRSSLDSQSCSFTDYQTMLSLAYSGNSIFLHAPKALMDCFWFYTLRTGLVNMIQSMGAISALDLQSLFLASSISSPFSFNEIIPEKVTRAEKGRKLVEERNENNIYNFLTFTNKKLINDPYWKEWMNILSKIENSNVIIKSFILEIGDRITQLPHTYLLFDKKWARNAFLGYIFKESRNEDYSDKDDHDYNENDENEINKEITEKDMKTDWRAIGNKDINNPFKDNKRLISHLILDNIHDTEALTKILLYITDKERNEEGDLNGIMAHVLLIANQLEKLEFVIASLKEASLEMGLLDLNLKNKINAIITITKSKYGLMKSSPFSQVEMLKKYELPLFNKDLDMMNREYLLYLEPLNYVSIGRRIFKDDKVLLSSSGRSLKIINNNSNENYENNDNETDNDTIMAIDCIGKLRIKGKNMENDNEKNNYTIALERDNGIHPIIKDGLQLSVNDLLMIVNGKKFKANELLNEWKHIEWPQKAILSDMLTHVHAFKVKIGKRK